MSLVRNPEVGMIRGDALINTYHLTLDVPLLAAVLRLFCAGVYAAILDDDLDSYNPDLFL